MRHNDGMPTFCERCGFENDESADDEDRRLIVGGSIGRAHLPLCLNCISDWERVCAAPGMGPHIDRIKATARAMEIVAEGTGLGHEANLQLLVGAICEADEAERYSDQMAMAFLSNVEADDLIEKANHRLACWERDHGARKRIDPVQ